MKSGRVLEIASNIHLKFFGLNVRRTGCPRSFSVEHSAKLPPIKNGKAVAESIVRKIDPLFPRIHYLNRPAGEHDGVLARTFRWVGRRDYILFLVKNSMRVRQWRLEDIHHPQSVLPRSRRSTVDHKEGLLRKLLKCICSLHWHTFATRLRSSRANHTPIRSHPGPSSPSIGSVRFPFLVRFEAHDSTT